MDLYLYIYMYAVNRRFYPKRLIHAIHIFVRMCSLGIEPTTFCAANAMLYHWATGTQFKGFYEGKNNKNNHV